MLTKAEIKLIRSLGDKASRYAEGLFAVEGEKLLDEVEDSGFSIRQVYRVGEQVTQAEMQRISFLKTPTPVLALVEIPYYSKRFGNRSFSFDHLTLALDGVQDPGNLGTIIRLADWFGVRNIYCSPDTADCWNPKVVQATMGGILRVRVHYRPLPDVLASARQQKIPVYGTFLEGKNIYEVENLKADRGVIVMGNEGRGITSEAARMVTDKLYIPPYPAGNPSAESLNVGVATGIILSEFRRRLLR